jgi:NifU-like protein involved in Fe-S cluster formation
MNLPLPQQIVEHFEDPFQQGVCDHPTHRAEGELSGSETEVIVIELRIIGEAEEQLIEEAWFDGEGGQACLGSASLLVEYVEKRNTTELEQFSDEMFLELIGVATGAAYVESCLLSLRVLREAILSPLDDESGPLFSGPHLGEEC